MRTTRFPLPLWAVLMLTMAPLKNDPAEQVKKVRVEPREFNGLLANPGMGWQTFHRFADNDPALAGIPSGSAYFRFYWREIEPGDGRIDFAKLDELLAHARRAGQKLAFRIMCTGSGQYMDVPQWLKDQGCAGFDFVYGRSTHWVPDFEDPLFKKAHFRLIRELGKRYDGHPDFDLLDIGSVGLWGEWHMSDTKIVGTGKPVPLPSVETRLAIIGAWRDAFPRTSKVILIGSVEGMSITEQAGYGWRADCLGDMGGFSKTWNHMEHFYMQQLAKTSSMNAWKRGPVAFESCWDMRKWKDEGWDIHFIYDYALRLHASYMNNKSSPIPEGTRDEVGRFLMKLGYRLVIRSIEHDAAARAGSNVSVVVNWENAGVAPPYRDYRIALRLRNESERGAKPVVTVADASIRGWLPGLHKTELRIAIPEGTPRGRYELSIALVEPGTHKPEVRIAIDGREEDGWYPISGMEISAR